MRPASRRSPAATDDRRSPPISTATAGPTSTSPRDSTAAILYRNNRDGTFTDVAVESGAAYSENGNPQAGMGVAVGDFNGDGRLDLLKTHFADDIPALYRNLGKGLFEDVADRGRPGGREPLRRVGRGLPDLDNDGRPDLFYVTGNVYPEIERVLPQYPHRRPAHRLPQHGSGRFDDVTTAERRRPPTPHSSRGAAFGDFDNDGDVDVLVMNMNEPPSLLRNDYRGGNGWIDDASSRARASNRAAIGATVDRHGRRPTAGARRPQPVQLLLARRPAAALRPGRRSGRLTDRNRAGRPVSRSGSSGVPGGRVVIVRDGSGDGRQER